MRGNSCAIFEIAKALARHILADADRKNAARENHAALVRETNLEIWMRGRSRTAILPERKTYLIGSHVGGIYRPGVRNSAGEFSSS